MAFQTFGFYFYLNHVKSIILPFILINYDLRINFLIICQQIFYKYYILYSFFFVPLQLNWQANNINSNLKLLSVRHLFWVLIERIH